MIQAFFFEHSLLARNIPIRTFALRTNFRLDRTAFRDPDMTASEALETVNFDSVHYCERQFSDSILVIGGYLPFVSLLKGNSNIPLTNILRGNLVSDFPRIKRKLERERGVLCQVCQRFKVEHLHHKDRNRKNNSPENLMLLCPDCHRAEHRKTKTGPFTRKPENGPRPQKRWSPE